MGNLDTPGSREPEVAPTQAIVAETRGEVNGLAEQVEQLSPVVQAITTQIDSQPESEKKDIFKMIGDGVEQLTTAIKNKEWSKAISGFTDLVKSLFSGGPGKPPYRRSEWNSWKGKETDFTQHDIDVLLAKLKSGSLSPEKKLSYARLISRRWDAEYLGIATSEPEKTEELLAFQAQQGRIKVGDMMIFGGPERGGALKEIALQAHVKDEMTHAAIITGLDPLEITHATKQGVHAISLMSYITKHQNMSYAVITGGGASSAAYAKKMAEEGVAYDTKNGLAKQFGDDDEMFCSELAIRAFAEGNGLDIAQVEKEGKVFPADLLTLSYPTYVGDYPREDT